MEVRTKEWRPSKEENALSRESIAPDGSKDLFSINDETVSAKDISQICHNIVWHVKNREKK